MRILAHARRVDRDHLAAGDETVRTPIRKAMAERRGDAHRGRRHRAADVAHLPRDPRAGEGPRPPCRPPIAAVHARIAEIEALTQRALNPFAPVAAAPIGATGVAGAGFAGSLVGATMAPPVGTTGGGTMTGMRMLAIARAEVGHAEHPPGSNDGPRLGASRADRHIGIVESVVPDGSLVAVEGNSSHAVPASCACPSLRPPPGAVRKMGRTPHAPAGGPALPSPHTDGGGGHDRGRDRAP